MFQFTLREPLASLETSCEVLCDPACCGLDAFDVKRQHIVPWIDAHGVPQTLEALTELEELAHTIQWECGPIVSDAHGFCDTWTLPAQCLDYLELWQSETMQALLQFAGG